MTFLNLSDNSLDNKTSHELAQALKAIPANVTSLNLGNNKLGCKTGAELAVALKAIPATATSLNLSGNQLQNLSVESINQLRNALPDIQTIYLCEAEIKAMHSTQRTALKAVLSTIPNIILLDNQGKALGGANPQAQHYFAGTLGITQSIPSLLSYAAFFVQHNVGAEQKATMLNQDEQDFINYF